MCDDGPIVGVQPGNTFYGHMTVERVPAIVQALLDGNEVQEFLVQSATLEESNKDR
jgi:(2Fe-2S) ferredoxin